MEKSAQEEHAVHVYMHAQFIIMSVFTCVLCMLLSVLWKGKGGRRDRQEDERMEPPPLRPCLA